MSKSLVTHAPVFIGCCALVLVSSVLLAAPALAVPTMWGVRGGAYAEPDDPFIGGEVQFDTGMKGAWQVNPNAEHVFMDDGSLSNVSCDFHYDIPSGSELSWWLGAGPTILFRDENVAGDDDSVDPGANLLVGASARTGEIRPYGQFKVVVSDDSAAVFAVGMRW